MFQSFDSTSTPDQAAPRVRALREHMARTQLDAFLIPRADAHQGEYVAACDERLSWLTGFTGSAGFAAIEATRAAVFSDGRYRLQLRAQCDAALFEFPEWPRESLSDWLKQGSAQRIGFDPWLHTAAQITQLKADLPDCEFIACDNLIDAIWADRPAPPVGQVIAMPLTLTGRSVAEKFDLIGEAATVLTLPDSICWLTNLRGSDIAHNPIVQAFAIVSNGRVELFSDPQKFTDVSLDERITLRAPDEFEAALKSLEGPVNFDPNSAPDAVRALLQSPVEAPDPCALPKACKTPAEISGMREAHLRDGAAVVEFMAWLSDQDQTELTEIDVTQKLESFRAATGELREISFDTICGTGPNGAIVHYRVTHETNRQIAEGDLLLIDSGGQYLDGTTDITRTLAIGTPSAEQKTAFTAVLKGMIALSKTCFPKTVTGAHLDALARAPLWEMGLDYDHGTGHGVGAYLCVHEGPQSISRRSNVPLEEGMILSNEPGYYREGAFGIRIENLIVVEPAQSPEGRDMFGFETLTFVPIDLSLVDPDALSPSERAWLNEYHQKVWVNLQDRLSINAAKWLKSATRAI